MKRNLVLLLALIAWFLIMRHNLAPFKLQRPCVAGLQGSPGVQIELASDVGDVGCLLEPANGFSSDAKRQLMGEQQYLDGIFIPLYWAFFWFVIGGPLWNSGKSAGRALGLLLRASVTVAAIADYLEDMAILSAICATYQGHLWPFTFGFPKWLFFLLALGFSGVFFLGYPKFGAFSASASRWKTLAARFVGIICLAGSALGLFGLIALFWRGAHF